MTDERTPPATPEPQPAGVAPGQPAVAEGLDPKIGAMLSYLLFGWVGGLIMFFTQKHPEVRFHAAQSIIVFGSLSVVSFLLSFLMTGLFGFFLFTMVAFLLNAVAFVLWILLSIKGYNLEHFKLPIAGDMAESWAAAQ